MNEKFDFIFDSMLATINITDAAMQVLDNYATRDRQEAHCKQLIRHNTLRMCKHITDLREAMLSDSVNAPPPRYTKCDVVKLLASYCEKAEKYAVPVINKIQFRCGMEEFYTAVDIDRSERIIFNSVAFIAENLDPKEKNKIVVTLSVKDGWHNVSVRTNHLRSFPAEMILDEELVQLPARRGAMPLTGDSGELGLWIAYRCAVRLGGRLKLKNTVKNGFEVLIQIPILSDDGEVSVLRECDDKIYAEDHAEKYFRGLFTEE